MPSMGLGFGLEKSTTTFKRKFRWLFNIPDISVEGVKALPPYKSARPNFGFKENEVQHLTETIFFPGKPEFKTFTLTLYDIRCDNNPVFDWIRGTLYDPESAKYNFIINGNGDEFNFKKNATLTMLDGCGNCIEMWGFDNVWPQNVDFQELDMSSSDVMMVDLTIRYDRAFLLNCS